MMWGLVATGLTLGLGIAIVWVKAEKVLKALDEIGDIFETIARAGADKNITQEELKEIWKEVGEGAAAVKAIIK